MASTVYKSPVIFAGENPGLTLYAPGEDRVVAAASYWRGTYSPAGEGNVLIIWYVGGDGGTARAIFADNAALGRFVTDTFTQHFGSFSDQGFAAVEPTMARFFQESDSRSYHRVACHAGEQVIELVWRDVRDRQMMLVSEMALGGRSFELATIMCPCGEASITIAGQPLAGEVRVSTDGGGRPRSSAFLAFAESWVDNGSVG
jgi:hypothetical protein